MSTMGRAYACHDHKRMDAKIYFTVWMFTRLVRKSLGMYDKITT